MELPPGIPLALAWVRAAPTFPPTFGFTSPPHPMKSAPSLSRREFVRYSAVLGAGVAGLARLPALRAQNSPSGKIIVGIMGLGRGRAHIAGFLGVPNVEIGYLCDVDANRLGAAMKQIEARQETPPKAVTDFRRILDDRDVDVLSIAAPNFWQAPATILACAAGKHVYVEKPASHNPHEAELMVAAARKYDRRVQMGNQRRSYPSMIEGIAKLHSGAIGRLLFARCWYRNSRRSIGRGAGASVPAGLDYTLWQGPTPDRPYVSNLVHYNWHWRWHWGGGELANNGVHALDIARWGLGVYHPRQVSYVGGRYHFDDDQETPDTGTASYDFGDKGITWDGSSCHPRKAEDLRFVTFYGLGGTMAMTSAGYTIHDPDGKVLFENPGTPGDVPHFRNLVNGIRHGEKLASEIGDGQISTQLCHLGNIAYRTGRTLAVDPASGRVTGDTAASRLWRREYRRGWEPKV